MFSLFIRIRSLVSGRFDELTAFIIYTLYRTIAALGPRGIARADFEYF